MLLWTALLAGSAPVIAAQSGTLDLPVLADPATGQQQPGRIVWMDLVTPDLAAEERFYAALFGWSFREMQAGQRPYAIAFDDGRPVAGLIQRALPQDGKRGPGWLGFISASDVDAATRVALQHGAHQRSPVRDYPQRGRQVILEDPQGVIFGVVSARGGDPPDVLAEPGQWIWSALFTTDPDNAAAFYQNVFGYEVYDLGDATDQAQAATSPNAQPHAQVTLTDSSSVSPSADDVTHLELASATYARATVNGLPADSHRRARWLHFVRVDDAAAAAAKAQQLGARVLVAPRADRQGGRLAVVADPTGALLGLMQWSDTETGTGAGSAQ